MEQINGLLVMDVDSTLIMEEGIDLLGEEAGVGTQVAAITERAMRGELDFEAALRERVALLKGLPEDIFARIAERIHFTPGAEDLVKELHKRGYKVGLVSGGFHETVDRLAEQLGEIVTKDTKLAMLNAWAAENNLELNQTLAMGDGANDLPMIQAAGLGIAFMAKPIVREQAPYQIRERNLYRVIDLLDHRKE